MANWISCRDGGECKNVASGSCLSLKVTQWINDYVVQSCRELGLRDIAYVYMGYSVAVT